MQPDDGTCLFFDDHILALDMIDMRRKRIKKIEHSLPNDGLGVFEAETANGNFELLWTTEERGINDVSTYLGLANLAASSDRCRLFLAVDDLLLPRAGSPIKDCRLLLVLGLISHDQHAVVAPFVPGQSRTGYG